MDIDYEKTAEVHSQTSRTGLLVIVAQLQAENAALRAETDKDLDEYEGYMGRLDACLCESLRKIGEDAAGFPDSIDVACRLLESIPTLRAEVERWKPREMTDQQVIQTLNDMKYRGVNDWRAYYASYAAPLLCESPSLSTEIRGSDARYIAQGLERDAKGGG